MFLFYGDVRVIPVMLRDPGSREQASHKGPKSPSHRHVDTGGDRGGQGGGRPKLDSLALAKGREPVLGPTILGAITCTRHRVPGRASGAWSHRATGHGRAPHRHTDIRAPRPSRDSSPDSRLSPRRRGNRY